MLFKKPYQRSNLAAASAATYRRCPTFWPQYPEKMQKSTATSGLPLNHGIFYDYES